MKTTTSLAAVVALVLGVAGGLSTAHGDPQAEPQKRPGPVSPPGPAVPKPGQPQSGPVGAPGGIEAMTPGEQIDSTMQRMARLIEQSQALSESFGKLATLHHGADRSEILMMQRMSDAMGAMAEEVKTSLEQYKRMVTDETPSESGTMKTEVDGLKGVLDVIAGEVNEALITLQQLEAQLGQG